jgi:serine/threonine protein phosphatase PrpC
VAWESEDHSPKRQSERARVVAASGSVEAGRVGGWLGVCRAIGEFDMRTGDKLPGLSDEPQSAHLALTPEHEFVIVASDGLWDVVPSAEAVAIARKELLAYDNDPAMAAEKLVEEARRRKSDDNVTVQVVTLGNPISRPPEAGGGAARQRPKLKLLPTGAKPPAPGDAQPTPGSAPPAGSRPQPQP